MLVKIDTLEPWRGERIGGKTLPSNIEALWSDAELKTVGLAKVERAKISAPTKLHREAGVTREKVGDKVIETPTFALPSRGEFISMMKAQAWALLGDKCFTPGLSLNDWTGYRGSLMTRGLALLAAYDEGGHDIDINAGSIDGSGAWPD